MLLRHSLGPVYAVPHLNGIQIDFHDPVLAPDEFNQGRKIRLQPLAYPTVIRPQKHILSRLLGDGAATPVTLAGPALLNGCTDGLEIKAMMLQVQLILTGNNGNRHVQGHVVQRNPVVPQPDLLAVRYLLTTADYHQRGYIYRHPTVGYNSKDCASEKQKHNPA